MRVIAAGGTSFELGAVETKPTIGITDFSRRVTDDFGVTTVVERSFSRQMSVKLALPFADVDALQRRLAGLRATSALWVADDRLASLSVRGFFKDFDLDLATRPLSYCTLTVEGLAEAAVPADAGGDPAPDGLPSTLQLLQPVVMTSGVLSASSVPEADAAEWAVATNYPTGARVMKAATHRIYESIANANVGNDPAGASGKWLDVGPTNRWAMFDQALGTSTSAAGSIVVTLEPSTAGAVGLLDVVAGTVRVQANGYDRMLPAGAGAITFLDLLPTGQVTVTIAGPGTVSVGTLLIGRVVPLGITEASPTAGITDFSRKTVDDFGDVAIVERAWSKRMAAKALIRTDAIDVVFNRIAAVRARPSLWIGQVGIDALTVYGFFKDFSIEVGETLSKLSLSIEGLSTAAKVKPLATSVAWPDITDPDGTKPENNATYGALPSQLQAIADAQKAADDAAALVDGKVETFFQPEAPSAGTIGDLWFDTNDGNKLYRHDGTGWAVATDASLAEAVRDAAGALAAVDGKITTFYATIAPTNAALGDLWYNSSNSGLFRWSGAAWLLVSTVGATADQVQAIADAASAADRAQTLADGKIETFFGAEAPAGSIGDLWFDTDDGNKVYRHNGTGWVAAKDTQIADAVNAASDAQATADGKVTTFYSATQPGSASLGDLWYNIGTAGLSRWSGSAWLLIATAGAPAGSSVNGRPVESVTGDLDLSGRNWFDLVQLEAGRDALMLARTTLNGMPIGVYAATLTTTFTDYRSATSTVLDYLGAKAGQATADIADVRTVVADLDGSTAERLQQLTAEIGTAQGQITDLSSVVTTEKTATVARLFQVKAQVDDVSGSIDDLRTVLIDPSGAVTAKAVFGLNVNGQVAGIVQTNNGVVSRMEMVFTAYNFLTPSGTSIFSYSDPAAGGDGKVYLPNVVVQSIAIAAVGTNQIATTALRQAYAVEMSSNIDLPSTTGQRVRYLSLTINKQLAASSLRITYNMRPRPGRDYAAQFVLGRTTGGSDIDMDVQWLWAASAEINGFRSLRLPVGLGRTFEGLAVGTHTIYVDAIAYGGGNNQGFMEAGSNLYVEEVKR